MHNGTSTSRSSSSQPDYKQMTNSPTRVGELVFIQTKEILSLICCGAVWKRGNTERYSTILHKAKFELDFPAESAIRARKVS